MCPAAAKNMEERLKGHVIGQEEAVKAVYRAVRRAQSGVRDPNRPAASFFFTGPTGVGKTELACALAIEYYGSKDSLIRLDMSEYMESHSVSKLFGSPPGYHDHDEGGQLTEAIREQPSCIILFDEIEKAHCNVWNTLLQILDYGFMTDGTGEKFDFRKTIIILTSNVGQSAVIQGIYNGDPPAMTKLKVRQQLHMVFRPEFLNRMDEILIFKTLAVEELDKIVDILLSKLVHRVKLTKGIEVKVTDALKKQIVKEGYEPGFGARPLKRAITRLVEDPLADAILDGRVVAGGSVTLKTSALPQLSGSKNYPTGKVNPISSVNGVMFPIQFGTAPYLNPSAMSIKLKCSEQTRTRRMIRPKLE
ncbi:Chaperone protein ClpC1, chloroplastic [Linum grandiflorum]